MKESPNYVLKMNLQYDYLEKIDVPEIVRQNKEPWFNQSLCKVNESVLRLGVFEGEFHWHKHDNDDEVFFLLEGALKLETEKGNFELSKYEGVCVPKGVMHRPVAESRAVVLMIENLGIVPTGD